MGLISQGKVNINIVISKEEEEKEILDEKKLNKKGKKKDGRNQKTPYE